MGTFFFKLSMWLYNNYNSIIHVVANFESRYGFNQAECDKGYITVAEEIVPIKKNGLMDVNNCDSKVPRL